jgi:hypothetical protein
MFCPRCGSPNTDTTKFCRQCGLSLAQLADYVASGGTAPLSPGNLPNLAQPVTQSLEGMTPRQKMALTIVGMLLLIPLFAMIGSLFNFADIASVPAMLLPFGIIWAVFHFRNQARRLAQEQWQRHLQMNQMPLGAPLPPPVQAYLQTPVQPPIQTPVQQSYERHPVYSAPQPASQPNPPNTNPLGTTPSSVIEDETKRLPDKQS